MVTGTIIFGSSRLKCGLIVGSETSCNGENTFGGNLGFDGQRDEHSRIPARIEKDMILLVSLAKPFVCAGKGTIVWQLTLEEYKEEIEMMN